MARPHPSVCADPQPPRSPRACAPQCASAASLPRPCHPGWRADRADGRHHWLLPKQLTLQMIPKKRGRKTPHGTLNNEYTRSSSQHTRAINGPQRRHGHGHDPEWDAAKAFQHLAPPNPHSLAMNAITAHTLIKPRLEGACGSSLLIQQEEDDDENYQVMNSHTTLSLATGSVGLLGSTAAVFFCS